MLVRVGSIFGAKLREHRESRGLSGNRLAMLSGLGQALENSLELGKRPPSYANLEALASVEELGVALEVLQAWADADRVGSEGIERIKKHAPELLGGTFVPFNVAAGEGARQFDVGRREYPEVDPPFSED